MIARLVRGVKRLRESAQSAGSDNDAAHPLGAELGPEVQAMLEEPPEQREGTVTAVAMSIATHQTVYVVVDADGRHYLLLASNQVERTGVGAEALPIPSRAVRVTNPLILEVDTPIIFDARPDLPDRASIWCTVKMGIVTACTQQGYDFGPSNQTESQPPPTST